MSGMRQHQARRRRIRRWPVVAATVAVLPLLGGMTAAQGGEIPSRAQSRPALRVHRPPSQRQVLVPVHRVVPRRIRTRAMPPWHRPAVTWPIASRAEVALTGVRRGAQHGQRSNAALASPGPGAVRAGRMPVRLRLLAQEAAAGAASPRAAVSVRVRMLGHQAARAAGVSGVLFTLSRSDQGTVPASVHLSLDYAGFAAAYGGDFGSRLHLETLPACAVATPGRAQCRSATPLVTGDNVRTTELGAVVTVAPGGVPLIIAASSSSSGSGGDYSATPLSHAGTWAESGSTGAFTYSYPISIPPAPGGLQPGVSLDYDSQAVDGLTSSTNNQASWIGDGWSYDPGFIQRDYQPCSEDTALPAKDQTSDLCFTSSNVTTMSLGGTSTTLVNDPTNGWTTEADNGETITYHASGTSNGTTPGDYWVVTTTDGTSYYFGLTLPGYSAAAGDTPANAAFTVPVYGPVSGDPCYQSSTFTSDSCKLAWRWQLDYVTDPHGDAMAFLYKKETNYYGQFNASTGTAAYTQGGVVSQIWYGIRASTTSIYASNGSPAGTAEVIFSSSENRTDFAGDLACASACAAPQAAPTFWTKFELNSIATWSLNNSTSAMAEVDSWALAHSYENIQSDPNNLPPLWLSTITRTGQDGTALALPKVTFAGQPLSNLAANPNNGAAGYSVISRDRLNLITTETGGQISVSYQGPSSSGPCVTGTLPTPDANRQLCFPDIWKQNGSTVTDWFNKYAVQSVTQIDNTGAAPNQVTSYSYSGPAWHYNDDSVTKPSERTWDQWRGFQQVTTQTGTAPDPVTKSTDTYFQGMNGDYQSGGGTTTASLTSTIVNVTYTDKDQWAGIDFEHTVYSGGSIVTDAVTAPWTSGATATQTQQSPLPPLVAYLTGEAKSFSYTALASGGYRKANVTFTHDPAGRVTSASTEPDTSDASQDSCTTTSYDQVPAAISDLPAEVTVTSGTCPASPPAPITPADLQSDMQYYYDGSTTLGQAPVRGSLSKVQQATSFTTGSNPVPVYSTMYTASHDQYGRTTKWASADHIADGKNSTIAYTPATGAEPTSETVADPMKLATVTTFDPLRELPLTVQNPAGLTTTRTYDALGRVTAAWIPGNASPGPANYKYAYQVSNTGTNPTTLTTTSMLEPGGGYLPSETLYDSLGRTRETQAENGNANTIVTDTTYNSDGWPALDSKPYTAGGLPVTSIVAAPPANVPDQTGFGYDGAGRVVKTVTYAHNAEQFETDTAYGGNYTTTSYATSTVPLAGTAQTTYTDGRGLNNYIYQYHGPSAPASPPAPGAGPKPGGTDSGSTYFWDQTAYGYTPGGRLASITDTAGNGWAYQYDLRGDKTSQTTPDSGTATSTFDAEGNLLSTTNSGGKTVSYTYDADNRKIAEYAATTGGQAASNQLAAWTYDTLKPGMLTSSTSYVGGSGTGGQAYMQDVTGYNSYGLPAVTQVSIPTGPLSGTYSTLYNYNLPSGTLASYTDGAAGGLPAENVGFSYDRAGNQTSLTGLSGYLNSLSYTDLGQPLQYQFGPGSAYLDDSYNDLGQFTEAQTLAGATPVTVGDQRYSYDSAGDVRSQTDTPAAGQGTPQDQCFQYDYLGRLVQAWSQATTTCPASPTQSAEAAAAAPYWDSYTYDSQGNLTSQTSTPETGPATTYTNCYPVAGGAQPHTIISQQTATGPCGTSATSYGWNTAGQLQTITPPGSGTANTLSWNNAGQLTSVSSGGTTTASYVYDASGDTLQQTDNGVVTLYLPDEQVVYTPASGGNPATTTATRYYSIGGIAVAARTSGGTVDYLVGNQQGTSTLAIDSGSLAVTRRYYDPYGNPVGPAPSAWPGTRGFVNSTPDTVTGLDIVGARQYNPAATTFTSPDPATLTPYNPQDLNPYSYAFGNPATLSDPTGLNSCPDDGRKHQGCKPPSQGGTGANEGGSGGDPGGTSGGYSPGGGPNQPTPLQQALAFLPGVAIPYYQYNLSPGGHGPDFHPPAWLSWQALIQACEQSRACPDSYARWIGKEAGDTMRAHQLAMMKCGAVKVACDFVNGAFTSVTGCVVVCVSISYQDASFQIAVGGLGFGGWASAVGVNGYDPSKTIPWTFGGCAALPVGGCGSATRNSGSSKVHFGGAVTIGEGGQFGLMFTVVNITPTGYTFYNPFERPDASGKP